MQTCMATGAAIHMGFPTVTERLDNREVEYLAGRELPEVPGLQLRQNSVDGNTVTIWGTVTVTTTATAPLPVTIVTPFPKASAQAGQGQGSVTPFFDANNTQATPTRPWMVTTSKTGRHQPSYLGLFVSVIGMLVLDYAQGYWR